MAAAALDFTHRYAYPSAVVEAPQGKGLVLATCGARHEQPHFFDGVVREPRVVGDMLLALTDVVRTHFFRPMPANLDPVVTSNEEMIRFEGFSGCCGVYARVDLSAQAFDSEIQGRGTTNVDFNEPMRASLMRLNDSEQVRLAVGREGVSLHRGDEQVVEKKVKLPIRWVKGFSEVQVYQPGLTLSLEVPGAEARRFVQSLPSSSAPKRPSFVVRTGRALRLSQRETRDAIRVSGVHRLRVLEPLMRKALGLRVWADANTGTSLWEVLYEHGRFSLMLSPEIYRGFSGEGQLLDTLAGSDWQAALPGVRAQLKWQNQIDVGSLATATGLGPDQVAAALTVLGSRGLAGFDTETGKYFHRELPFDLEQIDAMQPRLKNARALLADGGIDVLATPAKDAFDVSVPGTDVKHHVRLRSDGDRCSCPWFSKHQGERGPCKHILAARMFLDTDEDEQVAAAAS
jgi:hypothetical protein